jgi:ABC-2 type transport system permease protein
MRRWAPVLKWLRRKASIYGAFAANSVKLNLAYSIWFWVEFFGQILMMMILVYFWKAVYANADTVGGLSKETMMSYILFAQMLAPLTRWSLILDFGGLIREGAVAIEMVRPVDMQGRFYVEWLTSVGINILRQAIPLGVIAWLFFDLPVPTDPAVWGAFALSVALGITVLFLFDWTYAQLAFYTTEAWGLHILREGVAIFFSGSMIPLAILPDWLQTIAAGLPFGQALGAPVSLLTGITPVSAAPRLWAMQVVWLVVLFALSRYSFRVASRKVTVQGG